jgi:hypothetical protein
MQAALPNPWILDSETLIKRLENCRTLVMNIPISSLQETHVGIKHALNAICNLQEDVRYVLELHREAQQRFAKLAKTKPDKETTATQKAKIVSIRA